MATKTSQLVSKPSILTSAPVDPQAGISNVNHLVNHLKQAAYLELSSIPMYLYAGFSVGSRGYSQWSPGLGAFRLIRSVVVEEMLHLCLVRNVLVAVGHGDDIKFYDKGFVPSYPSPMLHRYPTLMLHLAPCSPELARDVFMEFERPTAQAGEGKPPKGQYPTIGAFYRAVSKGLTDLDTKLGPSLWANNQPTVQYVSAYWNNDGGGEPLLVENLTTALEALTMIMEQGEGIDATAASVPIDPLNPTPGLNELPHYTKFKQIADGIDPLGPVWSLPTDPRATDYQADEAIASINTLFNASYCYVLHMLDLLYATSWADMKPGTTDKRYHYERTFISAMQGILVSVAEAMVSTPVTKGLYGGKGNAGPSFEYYQLPRIGKRDHLIQLCDVAMQYFPALGGDNSVRWLLAKMPDV